MQILLFQVVKNQNLPTDIILNFLVGEKYRIHILNIVSMYNNAIIYHLWLCAGTMVDKDMKKENRRPTHNYQMYSAR